MDALDKAVESPQKPGDGSTVVVSTMKIITLGVAYANVLVWLVTTVYSKTQTTALFSDEVEKRILTDTYERSILQDAFLDLFDWNQNIDAYFRNTDAIHRIGSRVLHKVGKLCPPRSLFFSMHPGHMEAVKILKSLIMNEGTGMKAISLAAFLRQRPEVHPHAWVRAIYAASMSRSDLQGLSKPSIWNVIPGYFFSGPVLRRLRSRSQYGHFGGADDCENVSGHDGIKNGVENTLWYFREDIAVNSHHWNWHLLYPFDEDHKTERSGELFYFAHHELLTRYKTERISNRMLPVQPFQMLPDEEFPYHYYPNLLENYSKKFADRPAGTRVVDVRFDVLVNASERNAFKQRIVADIMQLILIDKNGIKVSLNGRDGIDKVGSTLESSLYSTNKELYMDRGVHNAGHILAAKVMDPDTPLEEMKLPGVMFETSVAMRDPIFYALHMDMDDVMKLYKNLLESYSSIGGLETREILLQSVQIQTPGKSPNTLNTFWNHAKFDLTKGLDFITDLTDPVTICQYHLDHLDFDYEFDIVSEFADVTPVTIRIFMHPLFDHQDARLTISEEQEHAFTLDHIKLDLQPGRNTFRHSSLLSQVTAPRHQHYEHGDDGNIKHCGCGWPHHMLIPKGRNESEGGLELGLFVIVTPIEISLERGRRSTQECEKSYVYCGEFGHSYPDSFPMGYPFDRKFDIDDGTTQELAEKVSNAAFTKITVFHEGSDLVTEG